MDGVSVARFLTGCFCLLLAIVSNVTRASEPERGSGAILSFPKESTAPMPDLASILVGLKRAGFTPSSSSLALRDGREVLKPWQEPLAIIGGGTRTLCTKPELSTGSLDPLNARLSRAETLILKADFAGARALAEEVSTYLPCLTVPVTPEILYRAAFLKGIAHYYEGQDETSKNAALQGFAQAAAIDPDFAWDRTHPPAAQEVFLRAARQQDRAPRLRFKRAVPDALEIWLDGRPVAAEAVVVAPAIHLLQLRPEPGAEVRTWMLDGRTESGADPVWIADGSLMSLYASLFSSPPGAASGMPSQVLSDGLIRWGRKEQHGWLLLVELNPDASLHASRYFNLITGQQTPPPPDLYNPSAAAQVELPPIAGRSGRKVTVPSPLLDWNIAVGPKVDRQLFIPEVEPSNYLALEVGGYREIQNGIAARFALDLGKFQRTEGSASSGGTFYVGLHLGVRKTWNIPPFGFFVEGGLFGCLCQAGDYAAELGLEARGGTGYYFNDPSRMNGIEFYFGPAILFTREILGQFGLSYIRHF